jgi:hypothetical protein
VEVVETYWVTSVQHLQVWATVLYNGATYTRMRGQYDMAEKMARASLEVCQEFLGLDDVATLGNRVMLV